MRAYPGQLEKNDGLAATSKNEPTHKRFNLDSLYARLRRLEQRMSEMENILTAVKRDNARIDKRYYRETEKKPSPIVDSEHSVAAQLNELLFS